MEFAGVMEVMTVEMADGARFRMGRGFDAVPESAARGGCDV